jgi:predicted NUDIX family NTP pyrophosphohydrolase
MPTPRVRPSSRRPDSHGVALVTALPSAGILLYRRGPGGLEVFIAHMGGPFWARKDDRAWSIPKGEFEAPEDALTAARREFREEIGVAAPDLDYVSLGEVRYSSGKVVTVFAAESDLEVAEVISETFELEWPPRSGRIQSFPEVDDARWVALEVARAKLVAGQLPALDALERLTAS